MGGAFARRVRCVSRVDTHAYCWKTQADWKDGAGNALHYVWLYAHLYFCAQDDAPADGQRRAHEAPGERRRDAARRRARVRGRRVERTVRIYLLSFLPSPKSLG